MWYNLDEICIHLRLKLKYYKFTFKKLVENLFNNCPFSADKKLIPQANSYPMS